jgi:hypothetical protein
LAIFRGDATSLVAAEQVRRRQRSYHLRWQRAAMPDTICGLHGKKIVFPVFFLVVLSAKALRAV